MSETVRLVVDQNIPLATEAFGRFGEVTLLPGREITREHLAQADALVVRSVTRVDAALLDGTPVRFVGTATIGTDHVDTAYLEQRGIRFTSAAGCNARSVVEYVLTALGEFCVARGMDWQGRTLGIVGHGNIGSRLAARARGLGMRVLVNDPPLQDGGTFEGVPLATVLAESDFVTFHVPYTTGGSHPTRHLVGAPQLAAMRPGALLINSSRGAVVDNAALLNAPDHLTVVLDVFEGEPRPRREVVERCFLATPHIAGYSYEGKVNGTRMMGDALRWFLNITTEWAPSLPPPAAPEITLPRGLPPMELLLHAMRTAYPIREDDAALRRGLALPDDAAWGAHFDGLRKNYHQRREFANYQVVNPPSDPALTRQLRQLHFLGLGA